MKKLKLVCDTCKEEKDITVIERTSESETISFSCGHKIVRAWHADVVTMKDDFCRAIHEDIKGNLTKDQTRKSGETNRIARSKLEIRKEEGLKIHKVWEQTLDGQWELVHSHIDPLPGKTKK